MVVILLLLVIVFASLLRLFQEVIFSAPSGETPAGDAGWPALLPIFLLFMLMLGLGLYIPAPLMQLLKGAASIVNQRI
jgi:hydrogenase-4 component F